MSADETVQADAKKTGRVTKRKRRAAKAPTPEVAQSRAEESASQDAESAAFLTQEHEQAGPTPRSDAHPLPGEVGTVTDPATADLPRPGSLPTTVQASAAAKDKVLTSEAAIALAHDALSEITEPLSVGAHAGACSEDVRVVTHLFECNLAGYRGWRWAVTLTRPPRARTATVCEMELLPGEDAILAPAWIPWVDRLQPGDVSRSDRLPRRETDERLEPGWEATGEEGDVVGMDALDFGRARVLSPEGLQRAAQRWYDGDHGPEAAGVRKAHATCSTCGFFIPLAGPLRNVFGICANEWSPDDGQVVSLDHGCGAHSETDLPDQGPEWPVLPARLDESAMEPIGTDGVSIRGGRTQAEELAEAVAQAPEAELAAGAELAASVVPASEGASASDAEPGQAESGEADAQGGQSAAAAGSSRRRATRKSASSGRSSRARRSTEEPSETDDSAPAPPGQRAASSRTRTAPQVPAGEVREPEQTPDRHAAALDAVAELAQAHGVGAGVPEDGHEPLASNAGPLTLDALEASLPLGR